MPLPQVFNVCLLLFYSRNGQTLQPERNDLIIIGACNLFPLIFNGYLLANTRQELKSPYLQDCSDLSSRICIHVCVHQV